MAYYYLVKNNHISEILEIKGFRLEASLVQFTLVKAIILIKSPQPSLFKRPVNSFSPVSEDHLLSAGAEA